MRHRRPEEIDLGGRTLAGVLAAHEKWLESDGREGDPADLRGRDLSSADLAKRDLRRVNLTGANLDGADLSRARLNGAALSGASFRHAALSGADLSDALLADVDFSGADLTVAKVPTKYGAEARLRSCGRALPTAQIATVFMAAASLAFTFLLLRTRDVDVVVDRVWFEGSLEIPTVALYTFSLPLFLGAYVLWHVFGLDPLWRRGAKLPAMLNDGTTIDSIVSLWPLNVVAAAEMPRLKEEDPSWTRRLRLWAAAFGLWYIAPLLVVCAWWLTLPRQDWMLTALAVVATAASVGVSSNLREAVRGRFGGKPVRRFTGAKRALAALAVVAAISFGALEWRLGTMLPTHAVLRFENLAGVDLARRGLADAQIAYCDLSGARLIGARMERAALISSNLAGANLNSADLRGGSLFDSNLAGAKLAKADLRGTNLRCAQDIDEEQMAASITDKETVLPNGDPGPYKSARTLWANPIECRTWNPSESARTP